jgi:hypothetical protein
MESAFGVEHVEKSDRVKNNRRGSALIGGGSVAAGTGLVAGGVPGAKSDFTSVFRVAEQRQAAAGRKGVRGAAARAKAWTPGFKATPGGILGFRTHAHAGGTYGFQEEAKEAAKKPVKNAADAFYRGRTEGKIAPEIKVMNGMIQGRKVAHGALGAGAAAIGAGAYLKHKSKVAKSRHSSDGYNATLVGAGGTGAVVSHGGAAFLDRKRKGYEASAARKVDEAGKLVPGLAGREGKKMNLRQMHQFRQKHGPDAPWPKTMYPSVHDSAVKRSPHIVAGVSEHAAKEAGKLRGAATQERHFAEVMGATAKGVRAFRGPSAIVGAVGLGGLAANSHRNKIKKSLSGFGVDHG